MTDSQLLPANLTTFVEQLKRQNESDLESVDVQYEGIHFAEKPIETFSIRMVGQHLSLIALSILPEGLRLENVFCHPRGTQVSLVLEIKRDRTEA